MEIAPVFSAGFRFARLGPHGSSTTALRDGRAVPGRAVSGGFGSTGSATLADCGLVVGSPRQGAGGIGDGGPVILSPAAGALAPRPVDGRLFELSSMSRQQKSFETRIHANSEKCRNALLYSLLYSVELYRSKW